MYSTTGTTRWCGTALKAVKPNVSKLHIDLRIWLPSKRKLEWRFTLVKVTLRARYKPQLRRLLERCYVSAHLCIHATTSRWDFCHHLDHVHSCYLENFRCIASRRLSVVILSLYFVSDEPVDCCAGRDVRLKLHLELVQKAVYLRLSHGLALVVLDIIPNRIMVESICKVG